MDPSTVERLLRKTLEEEQGRPISSRTRQAARSVEDYLKAGVRPRWMERIAEIERGMRAERRRLEQVYLALREQAGEDRELFARRWRRHAESVRFDELNELIRQHNEWYPIERDLPMDPRTGEYLPIMGRSFKRRPLGPDWVLEQFPPR